MNKRNRIIVLIDFSECSENLVDFAFSFSEIIKANVVFAHRISGLTPAMTDQGIRDEIIKAQSEEAHSKLRMLARDRIYSENAFHVSQKPILPLLRDIASEHFFDWVFAGLKGTGALKRLFIGSTTLSIIENSDLLTVAVPARKIPPVPKRLLVGVNKKYPLNKNQFSTVLSALKDQIHELEFFTILKEDEDETEAEDHLAYLKKEYEIHKPVVQLYRGKDAFSLLESRVELTEDSFLVLQQGSRSLNDKLFRTFMINELVYTAQIPLIVLSK